MIARLSLCAATVVLAACTAALPAPEATTADPRMSLEQKTAPDQKPAPNLQVAADQKAAPGQPLDAVQKAEKKKADRKATSDARKKVAKALKSGDVKENGLYEMASDELAMDCKRLTGSMKITIARLRDAQTRKGGSSLAETAHKTVPLIMGGSTAAADRQASLVRERAKIEAYNRQLAAKNCKTVDIQAELARTPEAKKY
jgi:hypothetical protein